MSVEAQKFKEAEETTQRLLGTLEQLHTEATSYNTATKELDAVRQRLVTLADATKDVVADTHEAVKTLRSIGGPEILERLSKLRTLVTLSFIGVLIAIVLAVIAALK